jgi:hypothetical protein
VHQTEKEVFSTDEFAQYAKTISSLSKSIFPGRNSLSAAQVKANAALQDKYGIQGYPTIIVLNSERHQGPSTGLSTGRTQSVHRQARQREEEIARDGRSVVSLLSPHGERVAEGR